MQLFAKYSLDEYTGPRDCPPASVVLLDRPRGHKPGLHSRVGLRTGRFSCLAGKAFVVGVDERLVCGPALVFIPVELEAGVDSGR